jgi:glycosyltransferase involved in cell wall biosynthesis
MIDVADHVVAGNRFLAQEAHAKPCSVFPTAVDLRIFRISDRPTSAKECVLGWIGTAENLPQWERLIPAFRQVCAKYPGVRFKIVSNREPEPCGLPVEFERFSIDRESECLQEFDVGLMPLEDTSWNRGKCSLKALQCMALEKPVVISPVGMNKEVVKPQVSGLFATTEDEWVRELGRLVDSPDLRGRMGRAARKTVEASYSLEDIGPKMVQLLERIEGA